VLTITSNRYGSASAVTVSGTAATNLLGATPTGATGQDAAGTLDGQTLLGAGRSLRGAAGTNLEGLFLDVQGGVLGARGSITYQTGFAYRLNELVKQVIGSDGAIASRTEGLQKEISAIGKRRDAFNAHLAQVESHYRAQFNALDTLLAALTNQAAALQQQLASLPRITGTDG
jgi:flagellar hook-associated protein 2